ncbi:homoserine kinase [Sediminivirga luteola]|uniref:Homoserine kinase n=1 Tax=Sediminivirga luteola TaxID=1774748 RepID=A0A8J2XEC6_9MICO|nr:homoserine kinase [Sediminivirga luteola]MCI2266537.1 homoserine kinase [Sediminivirga luteola]GGA07748.1 homoserine kinase [Sediminivirga luteola]
MPVTAGAGLPAGTVVEVSVPATSANLGPGYDSFGLAIDIRDTLRLTVTDRQEAEFVAVSGEDAAQIPRDERHLIARAIRKALPEFGLDPALPLRLECRNLIPHSRGLGSSASAVVAGVAAAGALAKAAGTAEPCDEDFLQLACAWEGHPDNAAPAIYGGVTLSWMSGPRARTACLAAHPDLELAQLVPATRLDTAVARELLPATVPHADAAANSARAGLLVHALTREPALLLEATADLLHQEYRRPAMPETLGLVDRLRQAGIAATVSGAGPTVLVLGTGGLAAAVESILGAQEVFALHRGRLAAEGVTAEVTRML